MNRAVSLMSLVNLVLLLLSLLAFTTSPRAQTPVGSIPAGYNLFFLDLDQDSYGDLNMPYAQPFPEPPNRLWTPWGNDPDDHNAARYPTPKVKGARLIGLDFADLGVSLTPRIAPARELGARVALIELRWSQVETGNRVYDTTLLANLRATALALQGAGFQVALAFDAISGNTLTIPADLRTRVQAGTLQLSASEVTGRAVAALGQVKQQLGTTTVVALRLGKDVDAYFPVQYTVAFWSGVHGFITSVGQQMRTASNLGTTLKVGIGASDVGLATEPTKGLLAAVNGASDWVFASLVPGTALNDPRQLRGRLTAALAAAGTKPLVLMPVGFPSASAAGGTELRQSQMLRALFDVWDEQADRMPLVVFSRLDDVAPTGIALLDSLALRQRDGTPKAAFHALRHLAFERGWWELPAPTARRFRMGFTQAPYDAPPDATGQAEVATYVDGKIRQHGDLIAVHLDGGVPWTEAAMDPFTSAQPPYSTSVIDSWRGYLTRRGGLASHKLLVSINPLGIPRHLLAAYWGYGQGYNYDAEYNRIPNGSYADAERRVPPAPFDQASFDDPRVQIAFLKYAIRTIEYFKPDYLCLGIEVSAADVLDEAAYKRYLSLQRFLYTQLKAMPQYANIKIFVSISATTFMTDEFGHLIDDPTRETGSPYKYDEMPGGMRARLRTGLSDLLPYVDILALSIYPHYGKYNAYTQPAGLYDSLFAFLKSAGLPDSKPIAVTESGYTGTSYDLLGTYFTGSPEKQDRHLKLMLYELNKRSYPLEFVVNFLVRDSDMQWQRMKDADPTSRFVEFYKYFRNIGLYDGTGNARPALTTWQSYSSLPYAR